VVNSRDSIPIRRGEDYGRRFNALSLASQVHSGGIAGVSQGHHINQAHYKSGIIPPEYHKGKGY